MVCKFLRSLIVSGVISFANIVSSDVHKEWQEFQEQTCEYFIFFLSGDLSGSLFLAACGDS